MASLDVDALFTNIPLDETIHICVKKFLKFRVLWLKAYLKMIFVIY